MSTFFQQLEVEYPIIQAPMAGVSTPELAAAVSNAGALGSLGIGAMTPDEARETIRKTKALTRRPFNVNLFCYTSVPSNPAEDQAWLQMLAPIFSSFGATAPIHLKELYTSFNHNDAMLAVLLDERPAVASFHFGLPPQEYLETLKEAGIKLMATATNLEEANQVANTGLHAIVAQGFEAGGHRGIFDPNGPDNCLSTMALTQRLTKEVDIPIISAGGIMNGAAIAAVIALGAQGAQLGTAFIRCPESAADTDFHTALTGPKAEHTVMSTAFSGRPARGLPNKLSELAARPDSPQVPVYPFAYAATKALSAVARSAGSSDFNTQLAGQGAPLSRAMSAANLVKVLCEEMKPE